MTELPTTQPPRKYKVLLIGDNCTDVYRYGTVDRISPEAPVPIFKFSHEESRPGMAANVQNNLIALGLDVTAYLGPKSIKTRLIDVRSKQHILRIDDDKKSSPFVFNDMREPQEIIQELNEFDAIVISDYDKGYISYELVEDIKAVYKGPVFVDTKKKDLKRFEGCFIKINETEYNALTSIPSELIITLGRDGAMYKQFNLNLEQVFVGRNVEVVDVCGAGDTFLASLVADFLNTKRIEDAIIFANRAAAISVQHQGVYTLTDSDVSDIKQQLNRK